LSAAALNSSRNRNFVHMKGESQRRRPRGASRRSQVLAKKLCRLEPDVILSQTPQPCCRRMLHTTYATAILSPSSEFKILLRFLDH
jgi:hypothetical protein